MKKSMIIAATITAGVSVLAYMLRKKMGKKAGNHNTNGKSHHLTQVFANAKAHAE